MTLAILEKPVPLTIDPDSVIKLDLILMASENVFYYVNLRD